MSVKQQLAATVDALPESVTIEEAIERIYAAFKLEQELGGAGGPRRWRALAGDPLAALCGQVEVTGDIVSPVSASDEWDEPGSYPPRRRTAMIRALVPKLTGPTGINVILWAAQTVAAIALARAGLLMLSTPPSELAGRMGEWVTFLSASSIEVLGVIQLVGAFAIWGPSFVRIAPKASGVAAAAFALLLAIVALVHGLRGELWPLVVNVALVAMMGFIAWGRIFKSPIQAHAHIRC